MSRRSSRASSVAAAAKIGGAIDDDHGIDDVPFEIEPPSATNSGGVLKGAETTKAGTSVDASTKKAKRKKKASPKKKKAATKTTEAPPDDDSDSNPKAKKKVTPKKRKSKSGDASPTDDKPTTESPKRKTSPKNKSKHPPEEDGNDSNLKAKKKATPKKRKSKSPPDDETSTSTPTTKKQKSPRKTKAADHQRWTERTPLVRHWDPAQQAMASSAGESYTFTVISWNVAGLRAFVRKQPDALMNLAKKYQADVICLQETKLQEGHLEDKKLKLREHFEEKLEGYDSYWSYSLEKKGYSGTAMFIKKHGGGGSMEDDAPDDSTKKGKKQATLGAFFGSKKGMNDEAAKDGVVEVTGDVPVSHMQPVNIDTELGLPAHDGEGRAITAEFPLFYLTNLYVPNSGAKLERHGYRTNQWDADLLAKMQHLEKAGNKPVIWLGDLNVAHNEKDTWNEGAKHLAKSAGTTVEERASFERQLGAGYIDAFRHLHPEGRGHYSYWSQRAGNREPNK